MNNSLISCIAGVGAAFAIGVLTHMEASITEVALVMAPFGATTVLVFGLPNSPLAQPKNVVLGHLITALIGVIFTQWIGVTPLTLAIATGLGVSMMLLTKTTHPPAGANPILIMLSGQSWWFLIFPVLSGALIIVAVGKLFQLLQGRLLNRP
ncbi:HPP family protein [Vibrio penaeicida]|uniref:HPP family protein n=1 Tax=Vibrio penaeicida TaxID=104609 RepID=A0AAV5NV22_9VIBR|nr:HPP family protein [Vibrio penaeicida]MDP2571887.1 HPP family protein [Vibrio penaeicida]RTZ21670.1 HPP family protein [Vibrio penaeicida]GLQ74368.1 HPP family protein [Vibrio penaeicida]